MQFRRLGSSGLQVSEVAYGNFLTHGSQVDLEQAKACVRAALDAGITTFDTADSYANGVAEEVLGEALDGVRRESIEVCTKVYFPVGPEPRSRNDGGLSRKHILEGIDNSLRRLRLDYVDLYQAHRFDPGTPLEETMQAFADVVRAGKAIYVGVSEWPAEKIREASTLASGLGLRLVSNQVQYSMLWRASEGEVADTCAELGIGLAAWSPLAQGVLTGKYRPHVAPPPESRAQDTRGGAKLIGRWLHDAVLEAVDRLQSVADEAGISLPHLALAWVLSRPNVCQVVVGGSRPEQITENALATGIVLPQGVEERVDEILAGVEPREPEPAATS